MNYQSFDRFVILSARLIVHVEKNGQTAISKCQRHFLNDLRSFPDWTVTEHNFFYLAKASSVASVRLIEDLWKEAGSAMMGGAECKRTSAGDDVIKRFIFVTDAPSSVVPCKPFQPCQIFFSTLEWSSVRCSTVVGHCLANKNKNRLKSVRVVCPKHQ
jgi:hypothetical protein